MRSPAADDSEFAAARARLAAMRLPPANGWVPVSGNVPQSAAGVGSGVPTQQDSAPPEPVAASVGELVRGWLNDRLPPPLGAVAQRAGAGTVVTAALAVAAVVLAALVLLHHPTGGATTAAPDVAGADAAPAPDLATGAPAPAAGADPTSIVVDVGGRVRKPGLVTLPAGARVADAIRAAGGPLHRAELRSTNLAARVSDGQLLLVGRSPPPVDAGAGASGGSDPASAPVSLNGATLEQLETLPGIGPVTGQKILDWRTAHGGFTSVGQLQDVSGIGPATYAEISALVTL